MFISKVKTLISPSNFNYRGFLCLGTRSETALNPGSFEMFSVCMFVRMCVERAAQKKSASYSKPRLDRSQIESIQLISSISVLEQKQGLKDIVIDFYAG